MLTSEQHTLLAEVPLFAELPPALLKAVADACTVLEVPAGQPLCHAGEPGEALFIVELGALSVWAGEAGVGEPLQQLGRGECVGEMAVVTGEPRSATVTAARASTLLCLGRAAFSALTAAHPPVLEAVARLLCRRLMAQNRGERHENLRSVAVVGGPGRAVVAEALARLITAFDPRPALLVVGPVTEGHTPSERPGLVRLDGAPGGTARDIERGLWSARGHFSRVIFDLDGVDSALAQHCHTVIEVGGARAGAQVGAQTGAWTVQVGGPAPPAHSCAPYVLTGPLTTGPDAAAELAADRTSRTGLALRRLARKLLGRCTGLALGGGAAYGFAHAGVLQALEARGLEIDLLTGTSAGAFFALAYAAGRTGSECVAYSEQVGKAGTILRNSDVVVGRSGLIQGDGLKALFNALAHPATTFADLVRPARAVATDVNTGERVDLGKGRLDEAFRASCSIPMLVEPVRWNGRVLVDGGMVDPVPADLLREMGADIVVAVNIGQRPRPGVRNTLSSAWEKVNRFNPLTWPGRARATLKGQPPQASLLEVGLNAIEATQYELGQHGALSADLVLNPDLAEFIWTDFHRPKALVQRGIEVVARNEAALRALLH